MDVRPYKIDIPEATLEDMRDRLGRTRFPDELQQSDWRYGMPLGYLREVVTYWREQYDWRRVEADLNRLPQFRARVNGLWIHFLHVRGVGGRPFPLILSHGWPGSILEFMKVIEPLTNPAAHGGSAEDAFDVVIPSLPGYGFSERPRAPGMDAERIAEHWAKLMTGLGYERFGAQGGDWGAFITAYLGARYSSRVAGVHLNMVFALPPDPASPLDGLNQEEITALLEVRNFFKEESAYQRVQGTKPQTLGYSLNDSPAGLAAWIIEKFRAWSDCDGDVERRFTKEELLANVTLYWVTETATSSARLYYETMHADQFPPQDLRVEVPTGCAIFPREIIRPPRAWAERVYNIRRWTEMPAGGHFAAMEEPTALVDDIRAFFRPLRG